MAKGDRTQGTVTLGQPLEPDPEVFEELRRRIWESARWTNSGPLVERLEAELGRLLGWEHVRACASGTSALTLALLALDLPTGGEVVTTPLTFAATALAIEAAGLVPRFAAVDPITLNLDPDAVAGAVGPRTVALLGVHLFGVPGDPGLDDLGARLGLPVVHDAAHGFGFAPLAGRGTVTAYSLHATKLLHTGEGGLVATNDADLASRVSELRNFGLHGEVSVARGLNAKLPELSAAVGLAMLGRLDAELAARRALRADYRRIVAASARVHPYAGTADRALVMEAVRCDRTDLDALRSDLAAGGLIARSFPALTEPGMRWCGAEVTGGSRQEVAATARSVLALPFHGRVATPHLEAFASVVGA